jgi:hypothetical protein
MTAGGNPVSVADIRCPECGRRASAESGRCLCGHDFRRDLIVPTDARVVQTEPRVATVFTPQPDTEHRLQRPSPGAVTSPVDGWIGSSPTATRGRVLIVRQAPNEPMDFDPWRWVAIPVWGLVLLVSPLVVAIIVWQSYGFLPAFGVAACSLLVLRFIFSDRLLQSWHLTAALNGRYIVEPMPVTLVRLRLTSGQEVQLRLKGQVAGGSIIEGDRVAAYGRWRSGVLHARRIECERTGATIVPRQPCARGLALAGLSVLAGAGLWLYFAGAPWVADQARTFRTSIQDRVETINSRPYFQ